MKRVIESISLKLQAEGCEKRDCAIREKKLFACAKNLHFKAWMIHAEEDESVGNFDPKAEQKQAFKVFYTHYTSNNETVRRAICIRQFMQNVFKIKGLLQHALLVAVVAWWGYPRSMADVGLWKSCNHLLIPSTAGHVLLGDEVRLNQIFGKIGGILSWFLKSPEETAEEFRQLVISFEQERVGKRLSGPERVRLSAQALDLGKKYLRLVGTGFLPQRVDAHQAIKLRPGENRLGRIVHMAEQKFGVQVLFDPFFAINHGLASNVDSDTVHVLMLSPATLIPQFSHTIIHELGHAQTTYRLRSNLPSNFYGRLWANRGKLPFAVDGYEGELAFDEMKSYLIDKSHLLARLRRELAEGNKEDAKITRMTLEFGLKDSNEVIGQVIDSARFLLGDLDKHPDRVDFRTVGGHQEAIMKFTEPDADYEAEIPLIRAPGEENLSDMEYLKTYLKRSVSIGERTIGRLKFYGQEVAATN